MAIELYAGGPILKEGTKEYDTYMQKSLLQTNMAYLMADVANSFAIESMANLSKISKDFRQEEKVKWRECARHARLLNQYLKQIIQSGYESNDAEIFMEDSDFLTDLLWLLCDRGGGNKETLERIKETIKNQFPSILNLYKNY